MTYEENDPIIFSGSEPPQAVDVGPTEIIRELAESLTNILMYRWKTLLGYYCMGSALPLTKKNIIY